MMSYGDYEVLNFAISAIIGYIVTGPNNLLYWSLYFIVIFRNNIFFWTPHSIFGI